MNKEVIFTNDAPKAIGPYVQAITSNGVIYASGQLGINAVTGELEEGLEAQAHAVMKNIGAILKEVGADYKNIVKTTVFITDMNNFAAVNSIYESYLMGSFPARSCVEISKLPKGGLIEIEFIAVL
jgi:2-iminobutanoate/2-iminopropanoate deaminase